MVTLTSAAGILSLLDEEETELKVLSLKRLNTIVDYFWAEISDSIAKIEVLAEEKSFQERELAALVASKVYYHLGEFEVSVNYALCAGQLFDVHTTSQYVETIVSKCIDQYTKLCVRNAEAVADKQTKIDPRLSDIVNRMFQRCFDHKKYKQAIGIALETRRLDIFERANVDKSDEMPALLSYSLKISLSLVQNRNFRSQVLRKLVELYHRLATPDYISVCQCLIFLDDPKAVADILEKLIKSTESNTLLAYQIAFDLYESASQQFLLRVRQSLQDTAPIAIPGLASKVKDQEDSNENVPTADKQEAMETDEVKDKAVSETPEKEEKVKPKQLSAEEKAYSDKMKKLKDILNGETITGINLQFLIRNNHADLLILKNTKEQIRNSICHTATVIANAVMHCGTTSDQFLRDNLEWLAKATNWAKFTATASLGVIHRGHESDAKSLLETYLPKESGPGSAYTEGGGLYAMGLIHANHGENITDYFLTQLKGATSEMVKHGGCLGIGLAAMGTARNDIYQQLNLLLCQDDAVTGEAAGLAMGLVMLGSKNETAIKDMVSYAQDTQHEKIIRGLSIGIALLMYGRLEESEHLVESLCRDKDPMLRRSGMYTLAMAYCGSGNNAAIQRLLRSAVSDVNGDVRRAAVEAIGFLLFRTPEQCPSVVSLLAESYNPHVRYGAAMALGISCAGTGLKEALTLLEPMTNDSVNYVRQGALIATALVLIQQTESTCSKVKEMRQLYTRVIGDKHEDVMAKFGAIVAQGIIDAGGRNVSISLQSRSGHMSMASVVGMLVFLQFWFWFPLAHFISLAFTPTSIIALNSKLEMPKVEFKSNAKPSTYAYPAPLEEKKEKEKEKVTTAVLSITAKAKRKELEKKKADADDKSAMEVDEDDNFPDFEAAKKNNRLKDLDLKQEEYIEWSKKAKESAKGAKNPLNTFLNFIEKKYQESTKKKVSGKETTQGSEKKEEEKEKEPEANFEMIKNPARVMKAQLKVMSLPEESRYSPLKPVQVGGIILMSDKRKEEPEDIVEILPTGGPKKEEELDEPEPPEAFTYAEDKEV